MHKLRLIMMIALVAGVLAGCGGGGGSTGGGGGANGLSLSGGSIPTGGSGSITGLAVLPNAQPLSSAVISARTLATGQAVPVTATLDKSGSFVVSGLPAGQDVEVVFQQMSGATLKAVVPGAQLTATATRPLNIGSVTALTTVVAQSLEQEVAQSPDRVGEIVSSQFDRLNTSVANEHQNEDQQREEITVIGKLAVAAGTLITYTASDSLQSLSSATDAGSANAALDSLLGHLGVQRGAPVSLSASERGDLTQQAHTTYPASAIASALNVAGVMVSSGDVSAADQSQRQNLPGWSALGQGITPLEALAIATCPTQAGGFQLSQAQTDQFLSALFSAGGNAGGGNHYPPGAPPHGSASLKR